MIIGDHLQGYTVIVGIVAGYYILDIWIVIFPGSVVSLLIAWLESSGPRYRFA
jgi:hypothetical protein